MSSSSSSSSRNNSNKPPLPSPMETWEQQHRTSTASAASPSSNSRTGGGLGMMMMTAASNTSAAAASAASNYDAAGLLGTRRILPLPGQRNKVRQSKNPVIRVEKMCPFNHCNLGLCRRRERHCQERPSPPGQTQPPGDLHREQQPPEDGGQLQSPPDLLGLVLGRRRRRRWRSSKRFGPVHVGAAARGQLPGNGTPSKMTSSFLLHQDRFHDTHLLRPLYRILTF